SSCFVLLPVWGGVAVVGPVVRLIFSSAGSFVLLVLALKAVSRSISYSIWAVLGTAGAAIVGSFVFNEKMSTSNMFGLLVMITGVVLMNVDKRDEAEEVSSHV